MGEVYSARDIKLGRIVAIKVLPEAVAADAQRIARLDSEARALASLNHPHIATLFGTDESDGRYFLVMEFVDGETLAERLERRPAFLRARIPASQPQKSPFVFKDLQHRVISLSNF